jgi:Na+-transporting NADH:ubiquinone oxidoreductase subunit NqrD
MKKIIPGILGAIADILIIIDIIAAFYTESNVKVFSYVVLGVAAFFLIGFVLWIATLIEKEIKIQKNLLKMREEEQRKKNAE